MGCQQAAEVKEDEPSYAELVVTYNAELEALDRLEKKRTELIEEHEKKSMPSADDALRMLQGVLETATDHRDDVEFFLKRDCDLLGAWEALPGEGPGSGEVHAERLRLCAVRPSPLRSRRVRPRWAAAIRAAVDRDALRGRRVRSCRLGRRRK